MTGYLLDTNVILRFCDASSPTHASVIGSVFQLLASGSDVYVTAQNIVEFWAVAGRPLNANGFGWDLERVAQEVDRLLDLFLLLEETPAIFNQWIELVSLRAVQGKQVHDARLIAVMKVHGLTNLLTFNTNDFTRYPDVTPVPPAFIK